MGQDPKKTPEIVLENTDVQELDVKERGNSKKNWKNKDLPFDNFVRDLPLWQQKLVPSLIDWATSSIAEPFGTTNHADFKTTIQDLWTKIFAYLPPKIADGSVRVDHPAIYSVVCFQSCRSLRLSHFFVGSSCRAYSSK